MSTMTTQTHASGRLQLDRRYPSGRRLQTPHDTTRVLVVDDHPAVRWGLVQLLEDQPDMAVTAVADTAEAALSQAEHAQVEVAVIDYHLGGRNGLWLTRKLKALDGPPRAVIFSAFANDHLAANCAVADADALLSKGSLGDDLCLAIRAVARGRRLLPRVAHPMRDLLRARLDSDEQRMILGMLLAGIHGEVIAERLGINLRELSEQRTRMLAKLERLPGERTLASAARAPLDFDRAVSR
jgi:two-component system, NarL family, response regulator DevR